MTCFLESSDMKQACTYRFLLTRGTARRHACNRICQVLGRYEKPQGQGQDGLPQIAEHRVWYTLSASSDDALKGFDLD